MPHLGCGLKPSFQSPGKNETAQICACVKNIVYSVATVFGAGFTSLFLACPIYSVLVSTGCGLRQSSRSPKMPRATMNPACVMNTSVSQEETIVSQESSSSDQEMEVQSPPGFQPSTSQTQFVQPMFMPCIEGPKMDWTVNDSLYYRFHNMEAEV